MENEKKVLIPLAEYEELVQTKEDFKKLREEFEKDCKKRGLYVKHELVFRPSIIFGCSTTDEVVKELAPRLTIYTKDEALQEAQKEMERISATYNNAILEKDKEIEKVMNRSLLERIFNVTAD
jgi:coproporphyrinogen III oxidase